MIDINNKKTIFSWREMKNKGYKLWDKKLIKTIFKIGVPIIISTIIFSVVDVVDVMSLGFWGSKDSIAALSISTRLYWFSLMLVWIIPNLYSFLLAQFFGAKKYEQMQDAFKSSVVFSTLVSFFILIIMFTLGKPIMKLFLGPDSSKNPHVIDMSFNYVRVYAVLILIEGFAEAFMNAMFAQGKQKQVMYIIVPTVLLNIPLNYILMVVFGLGYIGCAVSTLICFLVTNIVSLIYMFYGHKKKILHFTFPVKELFKLDNQINKMAIKRIFGALSVLLGRAILLTSMMILSREFGTFGVSVLGIITPWTQILLFASRGVTSSKSLLVGKELGANNLEKAYANDYRINIYTFVVAFSNMLLIMILAYPIPKIFIKQSWKVQHEATLCMLVFAISYIFIAMGSSFIQSLTIGGQSFQKFLSKSVLPLIFEVGILWIISANTSLRFWYMFAIYRLFKSLIIIPSFIFWYQKKWIVNVSKEYKHKKII
ncbi:MATE family efflux transporter [Mycoplasma marinum]|uniref:Probable multidrug resistance protein NorM n=1 Tax=Mycoplasma marinum TaxID=1937190 RepID=A0A4R0XVU6_9MOLU|nr:MATE family efflux transporter [Mycoplasma marinum]TCG11995.1 hypothetical protein C4B24_00065 [Mycoplasma marinum]